MTCTPPLGLLDGMSQQQLQAALSAAQAAYIDLMSGKQGVTFSYSQADGMKSVTYRQTDAGSLTALIRQLQQALGLQGSRRRPIRMLYR